MTQVRASRSRWFPIALLVLLAAIGFFVGWQRHMLWLAIVLAALGAGLAWLVWIMMRVALFTIAGALIAGVGLALLRSPWWFLGALAGAALGFWAGWHWHRPALFQRKAAP